MATSLRRLINTGIRNTTILNRINNRSIGSSYRNIGFVSTIHRNNLSQLSLSNTVQNKNFCVSASDQSENEQINTYKLNSNEFNDEELEKIKTVAKSIPQDGEPRLLLSWICANCGTRCTKQCRKRSYYETLVIMRCDNCRKWQLMSDHLEWFKDDAFEIQRLLEQSDNNQDPQIKAKITDIINSAVEKSKTEETETKEISNP